MMIKKSCIFFSIFLFGSFFITPDILPPPSNKKPPRIVEGRRNVRIIKRKRVNRSRPARSSLKPFHNSGRAISGSSSSHSSNSIGNNSGRTYHSHLGPERNYSGISGWNTGINRGARFYKKGHFNYTGFLNPKSKSKVYVYKTKKGMTVISDSLPANTQGKIEIIGKKDKQE